MARKSEIRYIQFYMDGSAARQVAPKAPQWKKPVPKFHQQKQPVLRVNPLAWCGIAVAAVMLVLMVVGIVQLHGIQQEAVAMQAYVDTLEAENTRLTQEFSEKCDLEAIERTALALGMVSVDEVEQVTIRVELPHEEEAVSTWDKIVTFLNGLFA